jgi:hypothetical protein
LQKMRALYRNLLLVRPRSAEFPLRPNQKSSRFRVDEQFWYWAGRQPARIGIDGRNNVFGFALDWQLSGPREHWLARRSRNSEIAPVDFECILRNSTLGQKIFDEEVLLKNQLLASVRALSLEESAGCVRPFVPRQKRSDDRFHVNNCFDLVGMSLCP